LNRITFNLDVGRYRVKQEATSSTVLVLLLTCFFVPWLIMMAYGAVTPRFIATAPALGYLEILAGWNALAFMISAIVGKSMDYIIDIKKLGAEEEICHDQEEHQS